MRARPAFWLLPVALFGSLGAAGQGSPQDSKTGKVLWLGPPRQATNSAIVKAADLLFFLNDDAELIVARSSQTGFEPLKRYTVAEGATWAVHLWQSSVHHGYCLTGIVDNRLSFA